MFYFEHLQVNLLSISQSYDKGYKASLAAGSSGVAFSLLVGHLGSILGVCNRGGEEAPIHLSYV